MSSVKHTERVEHTGQVEHTDHVNHAGHLGQTNRAEHAQQQPGRRRTDAGFSLIEVLVGTAVFTILFGLLTGLVVEMLRTESGTRGRIKNVDQVRVALDSVTKNLRTAVRPEQLGACTSACDAAFLPSTGSSVSFYANHGDAGKARLTTYRVEQNPDELGTGRLVELQSAAAAPAGAASHSCGAGCVQRVLATDLAWPVTQPVFSYADSGCATFGLTTALADIACVAVDLPVEGARDYPGTSANSTVFLPNSVMGR